MGRSPMYLSQTGLGAPVHGKAAVQGQTNKSVTRHPAIMAHRATAQIRNRLLLNVMSYDPRLAAVGWELPSPGAAGRLRCGLRGSGARQANGDADFPITRTASRIAR